MYAAFLAIVAAGGMYFLLSHRRFDVFSLAFFSGCIYFLPGFFGSVLDPGSETPVPIESGTYLVMSAVLTAIVAGGWWFGRATTPERAADRAHGLRSPGHPHCAACRHRQSGRCVVHGWSDLLLQ